MLLTCFKDPSMTRTLALAITIFSFSFNLSAQSTPGKDPLGELAGTTSLKWSVIGTESPATGACAVGEAYYTFQRSPAQVVVQQCAGGSWTSRTLPVTNWSTNGKSGVAFGGASYELKSLPQAAPVCKGNVNCLRLSSMPDGKTDATTTIYLTR